MKNKIIITIIYLLISIIGMTPKIAYADSEFSVSPMNQKIILTPGETYIGTFEIVNPVSNANVFNYNLNVEPFYVDANNDVIFENNGDYNQMTSWITLDSETGSIEPNNTSTVYFTINVPENAPAGGQYAMIRVTGNNDTTTTDSMNIQNILSIAHIIYAEVTGKTIRNGEILDTSLSSFLLSGNISASSLVKNTGNVHGDAKYTLQVFPLFSNEEIYTNEEKPEEKIVMPERELYHETIWYDTPPIGIFNVVYTVEFEGVTTQVSKMVIICPIWLLFIIIFAIIMLISYFVIKARSRKKSNQKTNKN